MDAVVRHLCHLRGGIARRLVLYLFLCSSAITLVGTSLQLYLEYSRDIHSIEKSLSQIEASYLQSLIESLWVSNDSILKIQLDGILKLPDVEYVEIEQDGKALLAAGRRGEGRTIDRDYPLSYLYRDRNVPLGTLHVVVDLQAVYQRLTDRALIILGTVSIKTFLVSLFMLFLFYALVGRHLHALTAFTREFDPDTEDAPLRLRRRSRKGAEDELDLLVHAFNAMGRNLRAAFREQRRNNERLRRQIAERQRAEEALRRSERKFRDLYQEFQTILDGIPDALTLLSADLRVVWANKGAARLSEKEPASLPGQPCHRIWMNRTEPCDGCLGLVCFETGKTVDGTRKTSDGRIWGKKVFPLKDPDGRVTHIIEWSSDITEKVRLAEEAERASRLASLGELSAGVAHEINNPNAMILLNAPVLQQAFEASAPILAEHCRLGGDFDVGGMLYSELIEEVPALFEGVVDGAERIRRIVDDLKDFVRQDGRGDDEPLGINDAVQTAVRLAAGAIKGATDDFTVTCADGLPPVRAGRQKIEQVLVNLILNACQALPGREGKIAISTDLDPQRGVILVAVRDDGVGIEAQHLGRIMDPFFTTKRKSGGTGLGLSISARIAREYGGRLDFVSTPGEGTTATLTLPILQEGQSA